MASKGRAGMRVLFFWKRKEPKENLTEKIFKFFKRGMGRSPVKKTNLATMNLCNITKNEAVCQMLAVAIDNLRCLCYTETVKRLSIVFTHALPPFFTIAANSGRKGATT